MGNAHGDPGRVTDLLVNLGACYQLQGKFAVVRAATLPRPATNLKLSSFRGLSTPPPKHPPSRLACALPAPDLPHVIVAIAGHVTGLVSLGILCQAKTLYRQALDRQPEDTRALSNLGSILTIEGQDDEAMVQLTHALRLGPTSSEVLSNLASLHHVSAASLWGPYS